MGVLKIIGIIIVLLVVVVLAGGYYFLHLLQSGGISVPVNVTSATGIGPYLTAAPAQDFNFLSNSSIPSSP